MIKTKWQYTQNTLIILFLALLFFSFTSLFAAAEVSIYDIQYTTNRGIDGTYPSPYINQTVKISGVVTATGFANNRMFVSMPQGGQWSAICVEQPSTSVTVGNLIEITGRVSEIMGMTVLTHTSELRIIQRNAPLPNPVSVTAHEALTNEAYESVLVRVLNARTVTRLSGNFIASVEDDTATINIGNGFGIATNSHNFAAGTNYHYIIGIVDFAFNRYSIHPRSEQDIMVLKTGSQQSSWGKIKSLYR